MNTTTGEWLARPYAIRLLPLTEADGGGWEACIPELGAMTYVAAGDTAQEALDALREVQAELFEDLAEAGQVPPEPEPEPIWDTELPSGKLNIRIARSLHAELRHRAAREGMSLNRYIEYLLAKRVGEASLAAEVRDALAQTKPLRVREA